MSDRVLLIGKRAAVLTKLRTALSRIGIEAEITQDVATAGADPADYRAVAFGRAVRPADRERIKAAFAESNPGLVYVDGLAPITPVLVAQFEEALQTRPPGQRRIASCDLTGLDLAVELRHRAHVSVTAHTLSRLYRAKQHDLLDESRPAGAVVLSLPPNLVRPGRTFLVVRADQGEVRVRPVT